MAFEHSPVVMYGLDNGLSPKAANLQVDDAREARWSRIEDTLANMDADTYTYPHFLKPIYRKAVLVAGMAAMTAASLVGVKGAYDLVTYDQTRPTPSGYCPNEAFGQEPPVTIVMEKSEAYKVAVGNQPGGENQALRVILTC